MNPITKEFIEYWSFYSESAGVDREEAQGDWACKYCENQDEVNEVLDQIDEYYDR